MKSISKCLLVVLALFYVTASSAQINVQTTVISRDLAFFFLRDIDINTRSVGPRIFEVLITVGPNPLVPTDINPHRARLNVSIIKDGTDQLFFGTSGEFPIDPNPGTIGPISSNEIFSPDGPYHLVDGSLEDEGEEIIKDILSTSRLPSGRYTFDVTVTDLTNQQNSLPNSFDIFITSTRKLDLIFPGQPATGSREDCMAIYSNLPQFRWESDISLVRVIVAEARPGEDPESALNQEPRFTRVFSVQGNQNLAVIANNLGINERIERLPSTSFQYPSSGEILTLRPGKAYYWRVIGILATSGGPFEIESEIFCFRIAALDEIGTGREQIDFILRNLLGSDYDRVFGAGGELEGYLAKRMVLNGKEITLAEILIRLEELSQRYSGYRIEN